MLSSRPIRIIGAGLAGSQAALTIVRLGGRVRLYEMRPVRQTAAHRTAHAAELVCSNSLRSDQPYSAPWLLKEELRMLGAELLEIAAKAAVPGGTSLTVDREAFARGVTRALEACPRIEIRREEVAELSPDEISVVASGPLTGDGLAQSLQRLTGERNLSFFDAVNPVVDAETVRLDRTFTASRYGKGGPDFVNCPLTREGYLAFRDALLAGDGYTLHDFDKAAFLGCPPVEQLARSGVDTLRYGPMRPVGLTDPATGRTPYAVVQLRRENLRNDSYNMVGFQNQLKYGDQQRIFRLIPALEGAEFIRFGQMHRNTYIRAPRLLAPPLNLTAHPQVFIAGQLCGVEGYVESIATGLVAGLNAWRRTLGLPVVSLPRESGLGAVCHYLAHAEPESFAPVRLTFDLLPPLEAPAAMARTRKLRRQQQCLRGLDALRSLLVDVAMANLTQRPAMAAPSSVERRHRAPA